VTTTLLIARHGNTFDPGDIVRRVGARTDLPLSSSGRAQAEKLGRYLCDHALQPHAVYTSTLRRTRQTAALALEAAGYASQCTALAQFNEIDYGVDENQPEDLVVKRIGAAALKAWEEDSVVPPGWRVDLTLIVKAWQDFAALCLARHYGQTILVVTSNGVARFAPHITGNAPALQQQHRLKLATGALAMLEHSESSWRVRGWNITP
jgi:2,3-bisphosphoglycerate-dependent phosphoglycerate mutase